MLPYQRQEAETPEEWKALSFANGLLFPQLIQLRDSKSMVGTGAGAGAGSEMSLGISLLARHVSELSSAWLSLLTQFPKTEALQSPLSCLNLF